MTRVPSPTTVLPWNLASVAVIEAGSTTGVVASRLLDSEPRRHAVYELYSVRASLSEDGTGNLASAAISDGPKLPEVVGNTDGDLMSVRSTNRIGGADSPSVWWHWGRGLQKTGTGDNTIYLPSGFYWDGEMYGIIQNGSGSFVTVLFTVIYRIVEFSKSDFMSLISKLPPGAGWKDVEVFT